MPTRLRPEWEGARLRALAQSGLTADCLKRELRRVLRFARGRFGTEAAFVSAVGEDTQVFVARDGVEVSQTGRDVSFCTHTIAQTDPLLICDAARDPRFSTNAFVRAGRIGFYAGVPMHLPDGAPFGSFCIADPGARSGFDSEDLDRLKELAAFSEVVARSHVLRRSRVRPLD